MQRDFSDNYQVNPGIRQKAVILQANKDSLKTYIRINSTSPKQQSNGYTLKYGIFKDYQSNKLRFRDSISTGKKRFFSIPYFGSFNIPVLLRDNQFILYTKVTDSLNDNQFIENHLIRLDKSSEFRNHHHFFHVNTNQPFFSPFIKTNDTFEIQHVNQKSHPLYIYYYKQTFNPAPPPISETQKTVQKSMRVDSFFSAKTGEHLSFSSPGLYFIQRDTNTAKGMGIRVEQPGFPDYTKAEKLIEPLVYITTDKEFKKLQQKEHPKQALDNFWLNIADDQFYARKLIKKYYTRVRLANKLFTSYKAGWKTDRGMIYIVMGPPDKVYKDNDGEEWIYKTSSGDRLNSFFFKRMNTIYHAENYILNRFNSYRSSWYPAVEKWRRGNIQP